MFQFNQVLESLGVDPKKTKLLRHDIRGVAAWRRGRDIFGCFASFQRKAINPYSNDSEQACHFLPGPNLPDGGMTAWYVGMSRITARWDWDGIRLPRLKDTLVIAGEQEGYNQGDQNVEAYDLEWIESGHFYSERLLIGWGLGARAWHQWAGRKQKPILELRMQAQEPAFPGFSNFLARISAIPTFPLYWLSALASVRGIYLLVADDGQQYVGSAYGSDGFIGRWQTYRANGHGNNVRLRNAGHKDYNVTILEVASSDMSAADIIAREGLWKIRLGARAHGLNAN